MEVYELTYSEKWQVLTAHGVPVVQETDLDEYIVPKQYRLQLGWIEPDAHKDYILHIYQTRYREDYDRLETYQKIAVLEAVGLEGKEFVSYKTLAKLLDWEPIWDSGSYDD